MRRRDFIRAIVGSAAAWPLAARAQQPDRTRLIGVLMGYAESDRTAQSWLAAFRGALTKLGWTENSKLRIELAVFSPTQLCERTPERSQSWVGLKTASSGSNFAGAPMIRIG